MDGRPDSWTADEARRRLAVAYRIEAAAALQAAERIEQGDRPATVRHIMQRHHSAVSEATEVLSALRSVRENRGIA